MEGVTACMYDIPKEFPPSVEYCSCVAEDSSTISNSAVKLFLSPSCERGIDIAYNKRNYWKHWHET